MLDLIAEVVFTARTHKRKQTHNVTHKLITDPNHTHRLPSAWVTDYSEHR